MSSMSIFGIKPDGEIEARFGIGNSWKGAAFVWAELGNKYLGWNNPLKVDMEDPFGWKRTRALAMGGNLSDVDWCVLTTTLDGVIIRKEHFDYVVKCYREFHKEFPNSHFGKIADAIEQMKNCIGVCFSWTSVNVNPWWVDLGDDNEEGRPYNINTDKRPRELRVDHWFFDPTKHSKNPKEETTNESSGTA